MLDVGDNKLTGTISENMRNLQFLGTSIFLLHDNVLSFTVESLLIGFFSLFRNCKHEDEPFQWDSPSSGWVNA
jgi:hypothetical protein